MKVLRKFCIYKGTIHVLEVETGHQEDKPDFLIWLWPTGIRPSDWEKFDLVGQPATKSRGTGWFYYPGNQWDRKYHLLNGGKTIATDVFDFPHRCPKVKSGIEVRYYCGRWQKYLKTKGWVDLPVVPPDSLFEFLREKGVITKAASAPAGGTYA